MYRILVEDLGTEGFGPVIDVEVKSFSLLTRRFPSDEEREAGSELCIVVGVRSSKL